MLFKKIVDARTDGQTDGRMNDEWRTDRRMDAWTIDDRQWAITSIRNIVSCITQSGFNKMMKLLNQCIISALNCLKLQKKFTLKVASDKKVNFMIVLQI